MIVKYLVKLKFEVEGVVERADVIGAIFGQTEGLFGPELNLNELQKSYKVGRIEINLGSKNDKTYGEVTIPMSTDISTAALIAAAIEQVDKVGPCEAKFRLAGIEDVRAIKRKIILQRAKEIVKEWAAKVASESDELLKDLTESVKKTRLVSYGKEGLPAGPGIFNSDTVYIVEGRADVINLLRAGIDNVIAIEGTKIPDSIIKLSKEKKIVAFLDGDRGGDLILKELKQVAKVSKVLRAPSGKEVEELTPSEILEMVKGVKEKRVAKVERRREIDERLVKKAKELYPTLAQTLEGILLDEKLNILARVPVSELPRVLENVDGAKHLIFDGIVTERIVNLCSKAGIETVVGYRIGEINGLPNKIKVSTFKDLGIIE
jgi:DNA primase